jgi:ribulose 1,5-bisphosphate carboxylase large subunit-like protein
MWDIMGMPNYAVMRNAAKWRAEDTDGVPVEVVIDRIRDQVIQLRVGGGGGYGGHAYLELAAARAVRDALDAAIDAVDPATQTGEDNLW